MNEKELAILDKTVIQANPLIEAKKYMNVTEMRLFILGLQGVKPHITDDFGYEYDVEFKETIIPTNQLIGVLGQTYGSISNLKKQLEKAYDSKITLNYKNGGFEFKHIYDIMKYEPEQGLVIKFDNKMKPYILEIVGQRYTKYKVKALFTLSSAYGWRILELLFTKQGYFKKGYQQVYIEYEIEKLREILNVGEGMYKKTTDFRINVLDKPIKEINEKTDYFVWYTTEKAGRRIKKIIIYMKLKETETDKKEIVPPADEAEQPPQLTSSAVTAEPTEPTKPAEHSAGVTLLKTIGINPPSSSVTATKIEKVTLAGTNWTKEQQADYDALIKQEVWVERAKMIINTYDHARINRNFNGVIIDSKKGTIANIPAVIVSAIQEDSYKGIAEERENARRREQARQKAEWEARQKAEQKAEEERAKDRAKSEEMAKIREQYTAEELNVVMAELKEIYLQNGSNVTNEIKAKLDEYGIGLVKFTLFVHNMGGEYKDKNK